MSICNQQGIEVNERGPRGLPSEIFDEVKNSRVSLRSFAMFCLREICDWTTEDVGEAFGVSQQSASRSVQSAKTNLQSVMRHRLKLGRNREDIEPEFDEVAHE